MKELFIQEWNRRGLKMRVPFKNTLSIAFFLCFFGCSPATLEDLRCEAESQVKKLALEMEKIETKEELQKAAPKLRKRFSEIADLLVQVQKIPHEPKELTEASEALFIEMARLYEIPGGREIVENAQGDALKKLR